MAQGQFTIPDYSPEGSFIDPALVAEVDSAFVDPFLASEVESSFDIETIRQLNSIKKVGAEIETLHSRATEANLPKLSPVERARESVMNAFVKSSAPRTLEDKLVEAESKISKKILPNIEGVEQRFWFHGGDWFYEVRNTKDSPMVARYHVGETDLYKLVDGSSTPFYKDATHDEKFNLVAMTQAQLDLIKREMYADLGDKQDYDLAA